MTDRTIGRYTVIRILGEGAMGVVHEARDPHLDRKVAIKTIRHSELTPSMADAYERRFLTEARSVARLNHPHIVRVFDVGQSGNDTFLVMEFVQGVNLKHCLRYDVRFTPAGAARILVDVLDAVSHAHAQKIIHRDIKPENILMDAAGTLKLTDFGIAKILDDEVDNGTQLLGKSIGTPRYMSPEQVRGLHIDERSDVFSAGVLLYELLTAKQPFDGGHHMAIASQILHDTPPQPSTLVPDVPPALDAVVQKALAKRPEDRYQNAAEFRADVFRAMAAVPEALGMVSSATQYVRPECENTLRHLLVPVQGTDAPAGIAGATDAFARTEGVIASPTESFPIDGTTFVPSMGAAVPPADSAPPVAQGPMDLETATPVTSTTATATKGRAARWPWFLALGVALLGVVWLLRPSAPAGPAPTQGVNAVTDPAQSLSAKEELVPLTTPAAPTPLVEPVAAESASGKDSEPAPAPAPAPPPKAASKSPSKHSKEVVAAPTAAATTGNASANPVANVAKPKVEPPPAPPASPPAQVEPCQGLSFLARESCLWDACYTDTYRRHPMCKRFANEGK